MGTISPSIPTLGDPNATEDVDVRNALITIRDEINGLLDTNNLKSTAGIELSQLETIGASELVIANGSGVITGVASSGDVIIDNTGAATIQPDAVDGSHIADDSIDSEHYVDGSIDTAHIANDAVDTQHIADGAITASKIENGVAESCILVRNGYSVNDLVDTSIPFTSTQVETVAGMHDPVTDNTRITAVAGGIYLCTLHMRMDNTSTGLLNGTIRFNGSTTVANSNVTGAALQPPALSITTHLTLAVGQYVEARVYHSESPSEDITTRFTLSRIGPAS